MLTPNRRPSLTPWHLGQARFFMRQLALPVSMMSQWRARSSATSAVPPEQPARSKWPLDLYRSINAPMESFFASLKTEHVHQVRFRTREEAKTAVFEYIEIFYNRRRLHSGVGYRTP